MKRKLQRKLIAFITLLMVCTITTGYGQQFIINSVTNASGSTVDISITTKGFVNYVAWQGTITWDNTKLTYNSLKYIAPQLSNGGFSPYLPTPTWDTATFGWNDGGNVARTLSDGAICATLTFNILPGATGTTNVKFSNTPTAEGLFDGNGTQINGVTWTDGTVSFAASNPTITTSAVTGSINTCSGSPSSGTESFTVSGSNLSSALTLNAPANFEISTSASSGFANSLSLTPTSGTVSSTTIYVRSAAAATTGNISGNVTATSGTASQTIAVSGTVNPNPSVTLGTINNVTAGSTSFSIPFSSASGSPNNYSISATAPNPMGNFSTVPTSTLGVSPINVPIPSSAAAGTYNFNLVLSNSSTTCSSTLPFTLQVTAAPVLTLSAITGSSTACSGSVAVSNEQFTVTGSNLPGNVTLTAPSNFEISTTSGSGYTGSITLSPVSGSVNATIYVRTTLNSAAGILNSSVQATVGNLSQSTAVKGTVNSNPSVTLGTINNVTSGTTTFSIPYSSATGIPDKYSVSSTTPNPMSNFSAVPPTSLNPSPLNVPIPSSATAGTYNFNLVIINSSTTCSSTLPFTLQVTAAPQPALTLSAVTGSSAACSGAVANSNEQFTVSGSNLTSNVTLTAPSNFEISTTSGSGYAGSITLTPVSGNINTTVYVRTTTNASSGSLNGNVTATSGNLSSTVAVTGTVNPTPSITLGTISSVTAGATSFSIPFSGAVGAPNSYSISTRMPNQMPNFTNVNVTALPSSPINVPIPNNPPANTYNFQMLLGSATGCVGIIPFTVQVNAAAPQINVGAVSGTITSCAGNASTNMQNFTVSGSNLTSVIQLNAPTNFEISTSISSGFTTSLLLHISGGTVPSTTIYVRSATNATTGNISGNITIMSSGTSNPPVAVAGTVNANPSLTIGSVSNVSANSTSFTLPFSGSSSFPDTYNIGNATTNVMPNFNGANGNLGTSPIVIPMPTPAPPAGTYNLFLVVNNTSTGCFSATYPFSVTILSANADLSYLTLNNAATLSPAFTSGTTSYTSTVPYSVSSITVTPTIADANAMVDVNGNGQISGNASSPISLNVGSNLVNIHVLAQDNTTAKTYQISITRKGQPVFSSFSPTTAGNGTQVTITGSNLDYVTGVSFGGVAATSFSIVSSTQITAIVPHATSGSVVLTDPSGTYTQPGFTYASPLPLSFISAKAFKQNGSVTIQWEVADASDSRLFTIQRSENGTSFTDLGNVSPTSQTHYQYVDANPLESNAYYRIRSTSVSGQVIYSEVIIVGTNSKQQITIFPNPVHGNKFSLHLNGNAGVYKITVVNSLGKQVYSTQINHNGSEATYQVKLPTVIAKGIYHVQVTLPDHSVQSQQIMIAGAE